MKTFVFDFDGVVCLGESFDVAMAREHGVSPELLRDFFKGPFVDCLSGRRDLKSEIAPLIKQWRWPGSGDDLLRFWFERGNRICPEALATVRLLRSAGYVCVLGTNQERYRTAYLRQAMGMEAEFDHVFASCELGASKPSREFFASIETRLSRTPGDLCLIDDAEKNIAGARQAGWSAIHYQNPRNIPSIKLAANLGSDSSLGA